MAALLHIVDRVPCPEGVVPLHKYLRAEINEDNGLVKEDSTATWKSIEAALRSQYEKVENLEGVSDELKAQLQLPVVPGAADDERDGFGPALDSGVYDMLSTKKKGFPDDMPVSRRNELKSRIFKFGCLLRVFNNNIQQPHGKYKALEVFCRKSFSCVSYSMKDIMAQVTNQRDECDI
jgi:hypothetical protein